MDVTSLEPNTQLTPNGRHQHRSERVHETGVDEHEVNENDGDGVVPFDGRFEREQSEECVFLGFVVDRCRLVLDIQRLFRYLLHVVVGVFLHISFHCHTGLVITETRDVWVGSLEHRYSLYVIHCFWFVGTESKKFLFWFFCYPCETNPKSTLHMKVYQNDRKLQFFRCLQARDEKRKFILHLPLSDGDSSPTEALYEPKNIFFSFFIRH